MFFVMRADGGLVGRCEDRLWQAIGLLSPAGSAMPHTDWLVWYSFQPSPPDTAHDGFNRQRLEFLDHDGAPGELFAFAGGDHGFRQQSSAWLGMMDLSLSNQKCRDAGEHFALAGIGWAITTSKAESRSGVTISSTVIAHA